MNKIVHWIAIGLLFSIALLIKGNFSWETITIGQVLSAIYLYISQIVNPTASVKK